MGLWISNGRKSVSAPYLTLEEILIYVLHSIPILNKFSRKIVYRFLRSPLY